MARCSPHPDPLPSRPARNKEGEENRGESFSSASGFTQNGRILTLVLTVGLMVSICVSAGMGFLKISWLDVARTILGTLFHHEPLMRDLDPLVQTIIMDVRLPRILTAAMVGGGLSLCGVVFQGILLNPLADPYTLGVSAGAAFGAAIALLLNLSLISACSVPAFAFIGAVATLILVIYLSASAGGPSANNLILSGIIVAAILSAGISFLKFVADEQVGVIIFWLMGSFVAKTWQDVGMATVLLVPGLAVFLFYARDLNLLCLGRKAAAALGVDARRTPWILLIAASLVAAACVAVSGIIGFVGLLVPHMMRSLAGPDNRRLLPLSFFSGAILLVWADTLSRAVLPHEIPIGVLTALIGGPFFCYLFRRRQTRVPGL